MVCFEPSTVYGNRQAYQEVLLIISQDSKNAFLKQPVWKHGVIAGVSMLARGDMVKPTKNDGRYGADSRFTKVQEMKQDCSIMLNVSFNMASVD